MGSCVPAASSSPMSMATVATIRSETNRVSFTSKQVAAAAMVSMVTSRVRGAASLGVVAWLVSVSYVTGADREELHGEEGQQESQEQLELQERYTLITHSQNVQLISKKLAFIDWSCDNSSSLYGITSSSRISTNSSNTSSLNSTTSNNSISRSRVSSSGSCRNKKCIGSSPSSASISFCLTSAVNSIAVPVPLVVLSAVLLDIREKVVTDTSIPSSRVISVHSSITCIPRIPNCVF